MNVFKYTYKMMTTKTAEPAAKLRKTLTNEGIEKFDKGFRKENKEITNN